MLPVAPFPRPAGRSHPHPTLCSRTPPAAVPDWLPPWSNQTALQLNLAASCKLQPLLRGYANATLCVNRQPSPLLAAALGGGLSGTCGAPCVHNPAALEGPQAVTGWRWDADNLCWWAAPAAPAVLRYAALWSMLCWSRCAARCAALR